MSFCLDSVLISSEYCSPSRAGCAVTASVQENDYAFTFCSAITISIRGLLYYALVNDSNKILLILL